MRLATMLCAAVSLSVTVGCKSFDYTKVMRQRVSSALGPEFQRYQVLSYPTDNFGVATMFDGSANNANFLCDTWNCLGINPVPTDESRLRDVNGFAAVGGGGATISLTEKEKTDIALNLLLPEIYQIVNAGGGYQKKQVVSTTLTIGQAYPRLLRRLQFLPFIQALPKTDLRREAFDAGRLAVIVGDVVLTGVSLKVNLNQTAAGNLDATFDPALPIKVKLFNGAQLGVKVTKEAEGVYTFEMPRPVVAMRLAKKQPAAGSLQAARNFDDWVTTTVPVRPSTVRTP